MLTTLQPHGRLDARKGWRNEAAASIVSRFAPQLSLDGCALVVDDDDGIVTEALEALGVQTFPWHRRALRGRTATAWIENGAFDNAFIRLPVGRETLDMLLHAAVSHLRIGGRLFVYGTNDEGIRSAAGNMKSLCGSAATLDTRNHSRLLAATRPETITGLRATLEDWRRFVSIDFGGKVRQMASYPGVFAHGKLDKGTETLLGVLPSVPSGLRVLDFGCGIGVIAAAMLEKSPDAQVDLLDIAAAAIHAAKENLPGSRAFLGDGWQALDNSRYDLILSNPPIHTGKGEDFRVLTRLIEGAPAKLRPGGALQIVVQRTVPAHDPLQNTFRKVEKVVSTPQFVVWRATGVAEARPRQESHLEEP